MPLSRRRRLGRILLNALTALSLLLCVGTVGLWVAHPRIAYQTWQSGHATFFLLAGDGGVAVARQRWTVLDATESVELPDTSLPRDLPRPDFTAYDKFRHVDGTGVSTLGPSADCWDFSRSEGWHRRGGLTSFTAIAPLWYGEDSWRAALPYPVALKWEGVVATFFVGTWCALRVFGGRRAAAHLCPRCRYDLTGNVSGTCPECGTKVG